MIKILLKTVSWNITLIHFIKIQELGLMY